MLIVVEVGFAAVVLADGVGEGDVQDGVVFAELQ